MTELTSAPLRVSRPVSGVVVLTLDVPDRRNAMTEELTAAWAREIPRLSTDPDVRCVVVTGAGSAFCSGGDLSWIGRGEDPTVLDYRDRMVPFYRTWLAVRDLELPVLAAVNGPAVGAGLCLALACDVRYAAAGARLSAPFTALGMHPGMAATRLLVEAVGVARARELMFTGRTVGAEEAERIGLVQGVHPDERLLDEVLAIAERIAGQAPVAQRLTKVALAGGGPPTVADALGWESLAQPVTLATEDLREGLAARAERRPPRFRGR